MTPVSMDPVESSLITNCPMWSSRGHFMTSRARSARNSPPSPSRQTRSNGVSALNDETSDLSEASISSDFEVAGAGFEPATFGL
jgi:hypothetical protein